MNDLTGCLPEDSWILDWERCWPLAESPTSYIIFTGYAMLGAMLGRRCWIDHDYRKLWPMLNCLFIGPSGIGKTTALELGMGPLLEYVPALKRPQVIEGAPTPEKLHVDLAANPYAILYAEELAAYFNKQKYMEGLIPYVTELLNYKARIERRSKIGGIITIDEPSVTVIGASTKEWLQQQLPDAAVSGGFLARFLVVAEEYKRQRVPLPAQAMSKKQQYDLAHHRQQTFQQFLALSGAAEGEIKWRDYSASDVYSLWYQSHKPASGHLAPFAARAGEFVQRLAMLTAVSCGRWELCGSDVTTAIDLYNYATKRLESVVVPMSRDGELQNKVLEVIGTAKMDDVTVRRHMRNIASAQAVDHIIGSLLLSKSITRGEEDRLLRRTNT